MSWWSKNISGPFSDAATAVAETVSAGVSNSYNYVASGEIISDTKYVAQQAYSTANYAWENPGRAAHIAMEGAQNGVASATGLATGVVAGAAGLVADGVNSTAYLAGLTAGQDWRLYEGSAALNNFSVAYGATTDATLNGINHLQTYTGLEELNPDDFTTAEEHILYATAQVSTEAVAVLGTTMITMGGGTAALLTSKSALAVEGSMIAGAAILESDNRLDISQDKTDLFIERMLEDYANIADPAPASAQTLGM